MVIPGETLHENSADAVGGKRILSRMDIQLLMGIGGQSAGKLMKDTGHCFTIAKQLFVLEDDLMAHLEHLASERAV